MKKMLAFIVLTIILVACAPSESVIQTAIAQTQSARSTNTPLPTAIPTRTLTGTPTRPPTRTPTQTATATFTPSQTPTPSDTPTPSITPTTIPLDQFNMLTIGFADTLRNNPRGLIGVYVRALSYKSDWDTEPYLGSYFLFTSDFGPRGLYVKVVVDSNADNTVSQMDSLKWMWLYAIGIEPVDELPRISVVHIETIPLDQEPKADGVYKVNIDIASGWWKSTEDATTAQSCYWARSNNNGEIIANFFGYGGTKVYVKSTDFAVEFRDCGLMVYLGK